jgi:hypothetical protein
MSAILFFASLAVSLAFNQAAGFAVAESTAIFVTGLVPFLVLVLGPSDEDIAERINYIEAYLKEAEAAWREHKERLAAEQRRAKAEAGLRRMSPLRAWVIAWAMLTVALVIIGLSLGHRAILAEAPPASAALIGFAALVHYSKSPCPGCARRWAGTAWDHVRKDGGPDLRFKSNYLRCSACGQIRRP